MGVVHRRRSLRLPHYDYSRAGYYFITITAHNRAHLFGEIVGGEMVLNGAGRMIERLWHEIPHDFANIALHEFVVMPNHIHGIIQITKPHNTVGAESISALDPASTHKHTVDQTPMIVHAPQRAEIDSVPTGTLKTNLSAVVQSFKRHTTLQYIHLVKTNQLPPFHKRIWQRNYYEHVIRDDADYVRIAEYIVNNPLTWVNDRLSTP